MGAGDADLPYEMRWLWREHERWRPILRRDVCAYCGGAGGTIDHIDHRAGRGANDVRNLTGACADCNVRKADRTLLGFLLAVALHDDRLRTYAQRTVGRGRLKGRFFTDEQVAAMRGAVGR